MYTVGLDVFQSLANLIIYIYLIYLRIKIKNIVSTIYLLLDLSLSLFVLHFQMLLNYDLETNTRGGVY
jgi:membrane protein CcdC involved in cytochrome C biogenesis